jgi:hypothetical protein
MLCEPLDETRITPRRLLRVVATLEFFEHLPAKMSHSWVPPVTHTLSRPQNYSPATAAATAAPAASFLSPNRKLQVEQQHLATVAQFMTSGLAVIRPEPQVFSSVGAS